MVEYKEKAEEIILETDWIHAGKAVKAKRDEWQDTLITSENLKSRESTLKEVEGYDDPNNWTSKFKEKFYFHLKEITEKVIGANQASQEARNTKAVTSIRSGKFLAVSSVSRKP